jgi:hypothetical protein
VPLTAAQICAKGAEIAKGPNFLTQAGEYLNSILSDLCQDHDFEVAAKTYYFNFNPGLIALIGQSIFGSGPYPLPNDFLRFKDGDPNAAIWFLQGVPYPMIPCDLSEFDMQVQQSGIQSYPYIIATDVSPSDAVQQGLPAGAAGAFYVYSPPSGTYPAQLRYQAQMTDIATPESSATIPWFPNQGYLLKKVASYVAMLTSDDRQQALSSEADDILRTYKIMKDNKTNRAQSVRLDRRMFGNTFTTLKNTKTVGWALFAAMFIPGLCGMIR